MGKLQRIQDLFRTGDVVLLEGHGPEKIPVYVAKLNALQKDEALKDGRSARARRMLAFDRDEDEQVQIQVLLAGLSNDDIIADLLNRQANELLVKADDEVRADPKWKERLEAIDRSDLAKDSNTSEAEQKVLLELNQEYDQAVTKLHQKYLREAKRDLDATPREELEKSYRAAWRELLGSNAFVENRRLSEIWYALRDCTVDLDADGNPILSTLVVGEPLCATRAEVNDLPDEVITKVIQALDGEMSPREAGNSDAPSASSGSSEQQSAEADSAPSTPKAT